MDLSRERILELLQNIPDPELPFLDIVELGMIRGVRCKNECAEIDFAPTYFACPAVDVIKNEIFQVLTQEGLTSVNIKLIFSPPWSTEDLHQTARDKLKLAGIAPPATHTEQLVQLSGKGSIPCPRCNSTETLRLSEFGATACKAMYRCSHCLEPFEYFKRM